MKVNKRMKSSTKNTIKTIMSRVLVVLLSYAMVSSTSPVGYVAAYGLDEATDQSAQTEQATTDQTAEAAPAESTQAAPTESTQSTTAQQSTQQSTQQAATEQTIALNLGNGYITYYGQTIAAPTSSLSVPTDRDFTFAVAANGGYTLKAVYRTMGESETPIAANSDGTYTLHASDFAAGVGIRIDAEATSTEGASTTSLTSAADALDQVLADSTETVYTYEDERVSVKATLSNPHAVPDDAQFVVTQVTPDTRDADGNPIYNYDAYMDALNGGKTTDDSTYTADNTLLYDVAFMYPELGDDGQPTGKTVEFEPAAGTVKIEITYKQNQLTDDLGVEQDQASSIEVHHLPLTDSAKQDVDTTADATSITKDDVKVEGTKDQTATVEGTQTTTFTTDSLSVFAVTGQPSAQVDSSNVQAYDALGITDLVGNAVNYGITADTWYFNGEAETSFAVNTLTGMNGATLNGGQNGSNSSKSSGAECQYIMVGHVNGWTMLKGYEAYITMPESEKDNLRNALDGGAQMHYTFDSQANIKSKVDGMISAAASTSSALAGRNSFANATVDADADSAGHMTIDFTQLPDNATYYIDVDNFGKSSDRWTWNSSTNQTEVSKSSALLYSLSTNGGLTIKKNTNQRVVFNFGGTNVKVNKFTVVDGGNTYDSVALCNTTTKTMDTIEDIVFNMPNATTVNLEDAAGVFLAPKADVSMSGVGGGWSISKTMTNHNEWHFTYDHVEKPDSKGFTFNKTVDGDPAAVNGFTFTLYQQNGSDWKELQTKTNNGGTVTFDKLTYDSTNCKKDKTTFIYKVVENGNGKVKIGDTEYTTDATTYYVKVVVTKTTSGNTTTYTASDPQYFTDAKCTTAVDGVPTFRNTTLQNGTLKITKTSVGHDTPDTATFTVTGPDGYSQTFTYADLKNAGGTYTLSNLAAGTYTVTEDATGAAVAGYNLTVTNNGVQTEVTLGNESTVALTNTYTKKTGAATFGGTKSYDGQLSAGLFSFTATLMKQDGKDVNNGASYHASVTADGKFSFGPISYDTTGTYIYKVTEDKGGTTQKGIVYDGSTYYVTVKVTEGADKLETAVSATDAKGNAIDGVTFTNKQYTASGSVTFKGTKSIDGRVMTADDVYTFVVKDNQTGQTWEVKNDANGKIKYPKIEYTLADLGTHTYTVTEKATGKEPTGISVSTQSYTVTVTVKDDVKDGKLEITTSDNAKALNFTNTYSATGSLTLSGTKTLENQALNANTASLFTYEVLEKKADGTLVTIASPVATNVDGSIAFPTISYGLTDVGTHTYIVREIIPQGSVETPTGSNIWKSGSYLYDGHNYTFTVDVEDAGNGTLSVTKTSGSVDFSTQDGAKVTGLDFKNTYEASGDVTLAVNKALVGRAPNANEFEFVLKDAKGNQIGDAVKNDEHGLATFPTISYTKKSLKQAVADGTATLNDDGTYTIVYTISEKAGSDSHITYSKDVVTATVTVTDNGQGKLTATVAYTGSDTITNTYDASGSITLTGTKTYEGQTAGQFSFTVTDENGNQVSTGTNKADGTIEFSPINYTLSQLRNADGTYSPKTFTYSVTEDKGGSTVDGITYDGAKKTVKVTVSDNGDGTLNTVVTQDSDSIAFTNTYKATGSVTFAGTKTMEGRALGAGEVYTFTVKEGDKTVATGSSDSTGKITFTSISYELGRDETQTHAYTITEDTPSQPGVSKASDPVTVKVTVKDDGKGGVTVTKTEGDYKAVNFTNKYESTGKLELAGTKTMEGRGLQDGDNFTYTVKDKTTGETVSTGTSDSTGTITYKDIKYTRDDLEKADGSYAESKTYTYVVSEDPVDNTKVPGVTASKQTYEFTVTITDDGNGHINVSTSGDDPKALDFTNTYEATGKVQFAGTKTMEGRDLTGADVYNFTISENNQVLYTFSNTGATINYPEIHYTLSDVGEHTYTIAEVAHDAAGVTTDTKTYTVKVNVSDKGDGTLKVETSGDDSQQLNFTNTYETSASVELGGTKKITGREFVEGDSYTFTLTGKDNAPMPTGADKTTNTATVTINPTSGSEVGFTFGTINYTQADAGKTYTYTVSEQAGDEGGLTYDDAVKTVKVKVADDGKGNLSAQIVSDESDDVVFTNKYTAKKTSVTLEGTKTLTGRALEANEFSFQVTEKVNGEDKVVATGKNDADGKIAFSTIEYTEAGEHDYTVSEVKPTQGGVTAKTGSYQVHVSVTDNKAGQLVATVTGDNQSLNFTNEYDAKGTVTLTGTKVYEGQTDNQFSFTVKDVDGKTVSTGKNKADGSINFTPIEYKLSDLPLNADGSHGARDYVYTVTEDNAGQTIAGITYSNVSYQVTVHVSDNGDGTLKAEVTKDSPKIKFTNIYGASGQLELAGTKTYEGQTEGQFTFTVKDADGNTVSTGANKVDGSIEFTPIHYNLRDAGKSYTYTVSEDHGGQTIAGITYDGTTYTFIATISDANHNGQLTVTTTGDNPKALNFTNTYNATGSMTLKGTKTYEGDKTGFTFTAVEQEDGVSTGRTFNGTTDKDGNITFGEIGYTLKNVGHTYTYTVTEDVPAQAENADGIAYADATAEQRAAGGFVYNGITYSNAVQTVTVEVKDDVKDGKLEVTPSANYQTLAFTNTYGAKGSITLTGTKTLTGRALQDGEFTFQVKEGNKVVATGHNDANGNITFDTISYTEAGEHDYTVSEVAPNKGGVTAGGQSYDIHVSVRDNGDGTLTATRTDTAGDLAFTNTYTAAGDVTFHGTKRFDTRTMRSTDTFTFNIDETTEGVANPYHGTATSKGGTINYPKISYTLADVGTHTYHVTEAATDAGGVTASEQSYDVTVTVADSDAHDGKLAITTSDNADALNFTNAYKASGQTTLTGTKTLTGRNMAEGEFGFTVKDASGVTVATGSNAAAADDQAGAITFTPIAYTQADMVDANGNYVSAKDFTYTVQENAGTKGGVAYSAQSFTVKVHVVDNGDGTLTATPTYPDGDINFTNTYTHTDTQVTFGGHKFVENKNEANADKTFTFQLTETTEGVAAADRVSQTVTRTGAGDYSFAPISYTEPGVHTYEIKETAGSDHGYTYDTKVYHVTVSVEDNGQGELVATATDTDTGAAFVTDSADFTNTYQAEATDIQLSAIKNLTGREWKDTDSFTFQLTAVDNAPMPAEGGDTATAATTGKHEATFGSIHYTQAGTYEYNISELKPEGEGVTNEGNGLYTLNGVTYNTNAIHVTVSVVDRDGQLVATPSYDNNTELDSETKSPVITNTYQASEATASLEATKVLNGGDIADFDGKFDFTLTAGDNDADVTTPMPAAAGDSSTYEVSNDKTGSVVFGEITYTKVGTYNYTITEVQGDQGGVTYDKTEHTAQVVVADDGNGALHATVTYDGVAATDDTPSPAPVFTNTYFAAKASIAADKHYFGAGDGTFEFTLTKTDASWNALSDDTGATVTYGADSQVVDEGQPFQVVVNNGAYENGVAKVAFPDITYYKAGTYYYKLAETSEDATDASVYLVTVTVDDSQQATVTYQAVRDGQEAADATTTDAAVFYNNGYVAVKGAARRARAARAVEHSVNVMPVVYKTLDDATLVDNEFAFHLTGEDGTNVYATNNADGTVAFARSAKDGVDISSDENGVLTFTKPGTYVYTISEVTSKSEFAEASERLGIDLDYSVLINYDTAPITLTVTVEADSDGTLAVTKKEYSKDGEVTDKPTFNNSVRSINLIVRKTSHDDPNWGLANATYGLWMVNQGGEDVYLGNSVSNSEGYITFEDFKPEKGKAYYFKEEKAPAGHLVNPYRDLYFTVADKDGVPTMYYEGSEEFTKYTGIEADVPDREDPNA